MMGAEAYVSPEGDFRGDAATFASLLSGGALLSALTRLR